MGGIVETGLEGGMCRPCCLVFVRRHLLAEAIIDIVAPGFRFDI